MKRSPPDSAPARGGWEGQNLNPVLIIGGFVIGALTGLTSVGAAALTTPFLILFIGVKPVKAVSTDFVYSAATRLLGTQRHWQQHTVDKGIMVRLAAASVPGLLVGTVVLHSVGTGKVANAFLTHMLGGVILLAGAALGWQTVRPSHDDDWKQRRTWPWRYILPCSFVLGILVGMTSVGAGSLFMVLLSLAVAIPLPNIIGTDVAHAALLTGAGAVISLGARTADPRITVNLLAGSLPGVWIGSALTTRLPRRALNGTLAVVLALSGARYLLG